MIRFRSIVTVGILSLAGDASAQRPLVVGGPIGPGFPGWYGPGPAGHRGSPVDTSWQYQRLSGGPFITPGYARGGPGFFPGWWGVPGAAGSTWSNGLSLYGPPVPTYLPVPGTFGNADMSRLFFDQPPPFFGTWIGLGWGSRYSPSPRPKPRSVSVYPQSIAQSVTVLPTANGPADCISIQVKLADPTADLWIDHKTTTKTGIDRTFESPTLEAGKSYKYLLLARWTENGKDRTESRTVTAEPGRTIRVDFTVAE